MDTFIARHTDTYICTIQMVGPPHGGKIEPSCGKQLLTCVVKLSFIYGDRHIGCWLTQHGEVGPLWGENRLAMQLNRVLYVRMYVRVCVYALVCMYMYALDSETGSLCVINKCLMCGE